MGQVHKIERSAGCHLLIVEFLVLCAELPFDTMIVRGMATTSQQAALWAKGRTVRSDVGPWTAENSFMGQTVTDALHIEDTAHGRGAAIDLVPLVKGVPEWDTKQPHNKARFDAIGALAERVRDNEGKPVYEWGGRFLRKRRGKLVPFYDGGHVQIADWRRLTLPERTIPATTH